MGSLTLPPRSIVRAAAQLRADIPGVRTPDALHAATAMNSGCSLFLSNDSGFKRIPNLPLGLLDDILAG